MTVEPRCSKPGNGPILMLLNLTPLNSAHAGRVSTGRLSQPSVLPLRIILCVVIWSSRWSGLAKTSTVDGQTSASDGGRRTGRGACPERTSFVVGNSRHNKHPALISEQHLSPPKSRLSTSAIPHLYIIPYAAFPTANQRTATTRAAHSPLAPALDRASTPVCCHSIAVIVDRPRHLHSWTSPPALLQTKTAATARTTTDRRHALRN